MARSVAPRLKEPPTDTCAFRCNCAAGDQDRRPSMTCDLHGMALENDVMTSHIFCLGVPAHRATTLMRNAVVDAAVRSAAGVITSRYGAASSRDEST